MGPRLKRQQRVRAQRLCWHESHGQAVSHGHTCWHKARHGQKTRRAENGRSKCMLQALFQAKHNPNISLVGVCMCAKLAVPSMTTVADRAGNRRCSRSGRLPLPLPLTPRSATPRVQERPGEARLAWANDLVTRHIRKPCETEANPSGNALQRIPTTVLYPSVHDCSPPSAPLLTRPHIKSLHRRLRHSNKQQGPLPRPSRQTARSGGDPVC